MGDLGDFRSLSIVIPTYNERENVEPLLGRLASVRARLPRDLEILVVDDESPDGTADAFAAFATRDALPVRVIRRPESRSLGRSIVEGLRQSRGELVLVMDADLSHPPEDVPRMLDALDGADGVVASRYAPGGRVVSWPRRRRLLSRGATALAKALIRTPCTDPVSGFFLFRRSALVGLRMNGVGNKPLLEILAGKAFTVHEVPYRFLDREHGRSKLGVEGMADFTRLLAVLCLRSARESPTGVVYEPSVGDRARGP